MSYTIRRRRELQGTAAGLAAHFDASTPTRTVALGELVYETDNDRWKVGDGLTAYAALPYAPAGDVRFTDPGIPNLDTTSASNDGRTYLDADVDANDRVLRGITDDGTNVLPIAEIGTLVGSPTPSDAAPFDIIIGAGQSNMGSSTDPIPAAVQVDAVDPRVFVWTLAGGIERLRDMATRLAMLARPDVHFALAYAHETLAPGRNVLVVNAGQGATGFSTTSLAGPPATYVAGTGTWDRALADPVNYYTRMIAWSTAAKAAAPAGSVFAALLWSQGESDVGNRTQAQYGTLLDDLIATARTDLAVPTLPVVVGSMVPEYTDQYVSTAAIARALEDTPRRVERTAFGWGPANLPDFTNNIHWSWQGQKARGPIFHRAYQRALCNVTGTEPIPPQGLTARRTGGTVLIEWEHPPCRITSFTVETKVNAGAWAAVPLTDATARTAEAALALGAADTVAVRARTTNSVGTSVNTRELRT